MNTFIVATFPDSASARAGIDVLKDLDSENLVQLHGAATVSKADDGKLTMHVVADDGLAVTAATAMVGGLAGLGVGPLAAAILAAGGAVFGASIGLSNRGAGKAYAEQVTQDLAPGSIAVVAEVTAEDISVLGIRLSAVGGTVTRQEPVK